MVCVSQDRQELYHQCSAEVTWPEVLPGERLWGEGPHSQHALASCEVHTSKFYLHVMFRKTIISSDYKEPTVNMVLSLKSLL